MHRLASVALATLLTATVLAQAPTSAPFQAPHPRGPFTDPANLGGERIAPLTGRELPIDKGALGLQELLRELNTRASILNIVAHPDDEDGGMLTLYACGLGARVADLSLTRGEGGQNAMTGDFEDALGLLRTQELLANDRYTGVSQMFGTEVDFGFSKTKTESFSKWTHERVLYDVVRAIRIYRPLVITSTWIGNPTDGHGQHQVSGEIAQEAFVAAGDPKIFPELTAEGILPWQPLKMYARIPREAVTARGVYDYATNQLVPARFVNYITGKVTTTTPSTDIVIHEGTDDPLLSTCAVNPSDLLSSLRPADISLSSRSDSPLSSRSAAEGSASPSTDATSASDCRPLSYVQFARLGLGLQKSQIGPGVRLARSGRFDVPYHLYGSRPYPCPDKPTYKVDPKFKGYGGCPPDFGWPNHPDNDNNFFQGIDTSFLSIENLAPEAFPSDSMTYIYRAIKAATEKFDPAHPEAVAPLLAIALKSMDELIPEVEQGRGDPTSKASALHELRIKRVQLNDALALSLGLTIDASANSVSGGDEIPKGSPLEVRMSLTQSSTNPLPLDNTYLSVDKPSPCEQTFLPAVENAYSDVVLSSNITQENLKLTSGCLAVVTKPYFKRSNIEQPYYDLARPALRNAPTSPPALIAWATVGYRGAQIRVGRVVHDSTQPVSVVPPASLSISSHAQVLPDSDTKVSLTLFESARSSPIVSEYDGAPANWKSLPISTAANCLGCDPIAWRVPLGHRQPVTLRPSLTLKNGDVITEGYRSVGYGDLPRTNFYTPATDRIVPVDLKLPPPNQRRIAYLKGTGDAVPAALASIGLKPTMLTVADLTPAKLSHFDTVILGVRTYAAHPDLHGAPTQALLAFARAGGNVLVQYQTPEFTAADAPYPLSLGSDEKVVDETVPVQITVKTPLLNRPNTITSTGPDSGFNGWIEERGHGFLSSWDPHYTASTETHDPGQAPQKGGLITVRLGKGRWTYCAFALYRQLPEAIPGAYRLFVNLLTPTP